MFASIVAQLASKQAGWQYNFSAPATASQIARAEANGVPKHLAAQGYRGFGKPLKKGAWRSTDTSKHVTKLWGGGKPRKRARQMEKKENITLSPAMAAKKAKYMKRAAKMKRENRGGWNRHRWNYQKGLPPWGMLCHTAFERFQFNKEIYAAVFDMQMKNMRCMGGLRQPEPGEQLSYACGCNMTRYLRTCAKNRGLVYHVYSNATALRSAGDEDDEWEKDGPGQVTHHRLQCLPRACKLHQLRKKLALDFFGPYQDWDDYSPMCPNSLVETPYQSNCSVRVQQFDRKTQWTGCDGDHHVGLPDSAEDAILAATDYSMVDRHIELVKVENAERGISSSLDNTMNDPMAAQMAQGIAGDDDGMLEGLQDEFHNAMLAMRRGDLSPQQKLASVAQSTGKVFIIARQGRSGDRIKDDSKNSPTQSKLNGMLSELMNGDGEGEGSMMGKLSRAAAIAGAGLGAAGGAQGLANAGSASELFRAITGGGEPASAAQPKSGPTQREAAAKRRSSARADVMFRSDDDDASDAAQRDRVRRQAKLMEADDLFGDEDEDDGGRSKRSRNSMRKKGVLAGILSGLVVMAALLSCLAKARSMRAASGYERVPLKPMG